MKSQTPTAARSDLERLIDLEHSDPHAILGAHPGPGGVSVRAYRPDASRVFLLIDDGVRREMAARPQAGFFEIFIPGREQVFSYRLEILHRDGGVLITRDPYSFLPTLGELDLHLWGEQKHQRAYEKLGAHPLEVGGTQGTAFAVWAPNAKSVSVVGDFNRWDGRVHMMRVLGGSGVWELFIPGIEPGAIYKYEIRPRDGGLLVKTDPMAQRMELPPATASIVFRSDYQFRDSDWMDARARRDPIGRPVSIYEVHLGSWRRSPEDGNRWLTYRELAPLLGDYAQELGFTHVQFMPVMEHPFAGSWGYR